MCGKTLLLRPYYVSDMDATTEAAVDWLLGSEEPAVRVLTRRNVLGRPPADDDTDRVLAGGWVTALLSSQQPDGGFGVHWYRKWTGAHWRLRALVELAVPAGEPRAVAAAETVLQSLASPRRRISVVDGLARACASVEGAALAVAARLGMADDPRAQRLAEWLVEWQWPDGGWNCDRDATGRRSSFHESLSTAWGLHEYGQATGEPAASEAARRAAELFLEHRVFRAMRTGDVIDRRWLRLRYPSYWHYELLPALLLLARMGLTHDPRAADALDELERKRLPDGRWAAQGRWWKPSDTAIARDVVDWGEPGTPNEMITLHALQVLRSAGRL